MYRLLAKRSLAYSNIYRVKVSDLLSATILRHCFPKVTFPLVLVNTAGDCRSLVDPLVGHGSHQVLKLALASTSDRYSARISEVFLCCHCSSALTYVH